MEGSEESNGKDWASEEGSTFPLLRLMAYWIVNPFLKSDENVELKRR
jgi:hypothetical protein